jgi:hypothetical protein
MAEQVTVTLCGGDSWLFLGPSKSVEQLAQVPPGPSVLWRPPRARTQQFEQHQACQALSTLVPFYGIISRAVAAEGVGWAPGGARQQ